MADKKDKNVPAPRIEFDFSKSDEENIKAYNEKYGTNKKGIIWGSNEPLDDGPVVEGTPRQFINITDMSGNTVKSFRRVPEIKLNRATGNIDVYGPKSVLENETFRKQVGPVLEKLSAAYKLDPNARVPVMASQGEITGADNSPTESIPELIDKLNSSNPGDEGSMGYYAAAIGALNNQRELDKRKYGISVDLSDEDMTIRSQVAVTGITGQKPKDNQRQAVSSAIGEWRLRQLDTYDPETGTAEYGDIMAHLWNRELGYTDEELKDMRSDVNERIIADEYSDDAQGRREAAQDIAFIEFLRGELPHTSLVRGVIDSLGNFVDYAGDQIMRKPSEALANLDTFLGGIEDGIQDMALTLVGVGEEDRKNLVGKIHINPISMSSDILDAVAGYEDDPHRDGDSFWEEVVLSDFERQVAARNEEREFIPQYAKGAGLVGESVVDIVYLIGLTKAADKVVNVGMGFIGDKIDKLNQGVGALGKAKELFATAEKAVATSKIGQKGVKVLESGKRIVGAVGKLPAVTKGLTFIGKVAPGVLTRIANLTAKINIGGIANTSAQVLMESFVQMAYLEPKLFRSLIESDELEPEARNAIMYSIMENTSDEIVAFGAGRALIGASKTVAGQVVSANISTFISRRQIKLAQKRDAFFEFIHKETPVEYAARISEEGGRWKTRKAQAIAERSARSLVYTAQAGADYIHTAGKSKDEIVNELAKRGEQVSAGFAASVAADDIARGSLGYINDVTIGDHDVNFRKSHESFLNVYKRVADAERKANIDIDPRRKVNARGLKNLISQETVNYVVGQNRIMVIDNFIKHFSEAEIVTDNTRSAMRAAKKEREYWAEVVEAFRGSKPTELVNAADELTGVYAKWSKSFTDLRMADGTMDIASIKAYRESGLWGEDGELYMKTQRVKDESKDSDWIFTRKDHRSIHDTVEAIDSYHFGSTDDFEDPFLVVFNQLQHQGDVYNRSVVVRSFVNLGDASVVMSSENVKYAKEMKKSRRGLDNILKKGMESIVRDSTKQGLGALQADFTLASSKVKAAEGKVKATEGKIERLKAKKKQATSLVYRKHYTASLDQDKVNELWNKRFGSIFGDGAGKYVDTMNNELPLEAKMAILNEYNKYTSMNPLLFNDEMLKQASDAEIGNISRYIHTDGKEAPTRQRRRLLSENIGKDASDYIFDTIRARKESAYVSKKSLPPLDWESLKEGLGNNRLRHKDLPSGMRGMFLDGSGVDVTRDGLKLTDEGKALASNPEIMKIRDERVKRWESYGDELSDDLKEVKAEDVLEYYKRVAAQGSPATVTNADVKDFLENMTDEDKNALSERIGGFIRNKAESDVLSRTYNPAEIYKSYVERYASSEEVAALDEKIKRAVLSNEDAVLDSEEIVKGAGDKYKEESLAKLAENLSQEKDVRFEAREELNLARKELLEKSEVITTNLFKRLENNDEINRVVDLLANRYKVADKETLKKYLILDAYQQNAKSIKEGIAAKVDSSLQKQLKGATGSDAGLRAAGRHLADMVDTGLMNEFSKVNAYMQDYYPDLVDRDAIYDEVRSLCDEISKNERRSYKDGIVGLINDGGETEYVKVDPLIAMFAKSSPGYQRMGVIEKMNYLWMKSFRMGTTTMNIRSMMNQSFRDPINGFLGSGWFFNSTKGLMKDAYNTLGDDVVNFINSYDPQLGREVEEGVVSSEEAFARAFKSSRSTGKAVSPTATETASYSMAKETESLKRNKRTGRVTEGDMGKLSSGINKAIEWFGKPNEIRESSLRNATYNKAFADAVKRGYSYDNAVTYAKFIQSNATTNFSQSMVHLSALQRTVPYLGAAINGHRSFFRLLALDPVGVYGRLLGGVAIPVMYLTAQSLGSEENIELWKQIPEYQKDDNLVFVAGGQVFSIPIPQEVSFFINPFRHMVEKMYDANEHTFWELAANNLLNLSPVDLSGFTNIDRSRMFEDVNVMDNVSAGLTRVWSQLAPAPLKSAAMMITGIDPFTLNKIDTTYQVINPDTLETEVMDKRTGVFAKTFASITEQFLGAKISAPMAEKVIQGIIGTAGVDAANWLTGFSVGIVEGDAQKTADALEGVMNDTITNLASAITVDTYDRAERDWRQAINQLNEEKDAILNSEEAKLYMKKARKVLESGDEEALLKLKEERANLFGEFFTEVKNVSMRLKNTYKKNFTADKFNAVLSLMVIDSIVGDYSTTRGKEYMQQLYYDSKGRAIRTMIDMGFPATSPADAMIGKVYKDEFTGEVKISLYNPVTILDMKNQLFYSGSLHSANIENILKEKGITREAMFAGYDGLSKQEKAAYKRAWNEKVVLALAPYMKEYGVNNLLNDSSIRESLNDYLFIKGQWGADQYLKSIFKEDSNGR